MVIIYIIQVCGAFGNLTVLVRLDANLFKEEGDEVED
jgi:hypothetical protein